MAYSTSTTVSDLLNQALEGVSTSNHHVPKDIEGNEELLTRTQLSSALPRARKGTRRAIRKGKKL